MKPYFSIVIPIFNREHLIRRSIESCLAQEFGDFEIIAVDDGSTDRSAEVISAFDDPRIKLLRHEVNQGVSPTRNTGISGAQGEWIVFLDSDDELTPGALGTIYARSREIPPEISSMQFMGRRDSGEPSPDPALTSRRWGYEAYLEMLELTYGRHHDWTAVVRRSTFEKVRFNEDRSFEGLYHLEFHRNFIGWGFPDIVALYHQDAENQLTKPQASQSIATSSDQAVSTELLMAMHGHALKQHAPRIYAELLANLATLSFLSGDRARGAKRALAALRNEPFSLRPWVILAVGLLGSRALAWAKTVRGRWLTARRRLRQSAIP